MFDGDIQNPLLDLFGRPLPMLPTSVNERAGGSVRQSLHMVNSDHFLGKIAGSPSLQRLLQWGKPDPELVDEIYLATLARLGSSQKNRRSLTT